MKHQIIVLIIVSFLFSCAREPDNHQRTVIRGKIENPISDNIGILVFDDMITRDNSKLSTTVDDSGRFKLVFSIQEPQKVFLSRPRSNNLLFLYPGDSLSIYFDDKDVRRTMSFDGSSANQNLYLSTFSLNYNMGNFFMKMRDLPPAEFKKLVLANRNNALDAFNAFELKNELGEAFRQFALAQINYQFYSMLFMCENIQKQMQKGDADSLGFTDEYFDFIVDSDFHNDEALINADDYLNALSSYVLHKIGASESYQEHLDKAYIFANDNLESRTREYFQAKLILYMIERTSSIDSARVNDFLGHCESEKVREIVATLYEKHINISSMQGSSLPDEILLSSLYNREGGEITFRELLNKQSGKLVFLDIWSLGCKPCLDEMSYSRGLIKKYADEDISFIFLSTDEMTDMWDKGIQISGIDDGHYRLVGGFQSALLKQLNIKAIPRYIFLDKEGKVLDVDAKRPSSKALIEEIDKRLSSE